MIAGHVKEELDRLATQAIEDSAPRALADEILDRCWSGGADFREARDYVEAKIREGQRIRLGVRRR